MRRTSLPAGEGVALGALSVVTLAGVTPVEITEELAVAGVLLRLGERESLTEGVRDTAECTETCRDSCLVMGVVGFATGPAASCESNNDASCRHACCLHRALPKLISLCMHKHNGFCINASLTTLRQVILK